MNKRWVLLIGVAVLVGVCLPAGATGVTVTFDGKTILDNYAPDSTGLKATQPDARRVHDPVWGNQCYGTFSDYLQAGHSQPTDYNTYVAWRNSLTHVGDGLAVFNVWFIDQPGARSWGEVTVVKPNTTVTATAPDGWSYTIIADPYGIGGDVVQWYTLDPTKRLRPTDLGGLDVGQFSVTAELYWDTNANGWDASDTPVAQGETMRFWVGCLNGDDPGFYRTDTQAIYYSGAVYSDTAGVYGSGFEAALSVPEPLTMLAVFGGVCGLGGYIRRRKPA